MGKGANILSRLFSLLTKMSSVIEGYDLNECCSNKYAFKNLTFWHSTTLFEKEDDTENTYISFTNQMCSQFVFCGTWPKNV